MRRSMSALEHVAAAHNGATGSSDPVAWAHTVVLGHHTAPRTHRRRQQAEGDGARHGGSTGVGISYQISTT